MKKSLSVMILVIMFLLVIGSALNASNTPIKAFKVGKDYLQLSETRRMDYISGLCGMYFYMMSVTFPEKYQHMREKMKNISPEQIKEIFEKYLEDHPEQLHCGTASLFKQAIYTVIKE